MTKIRNFLILSGIAILTVTIARAGSTSTGSRKVKCDFNGDSKVDISDIIRYNGSCKAHDSNTPEWCDLNGDGNSDVSDDVAIQDKCMQIIAGFSVDDEAEQKEYDKCDLNKDSKIDNSDNVRFSNKCSSYSANRPKECDINGDGKYDVSDRVKLTNCLAGTTNGSSSNNEEIEEAEKEYDKCDLNKDSKIDNSDNVRFSNKCSSYSANGPKECDINGDGQFNISDRVKLSNCIAGVTDGNSTDEEEKEYDKCDVNKDGNIDNSDNVRYKSKCGTFDANSPKECDVNGDGQFNISDRVKLSNCIAGVTDGNSTDEEEKDKNNTPNYSNELQEAYNWAYSEGIISESSIDNANLYDALTNLELADIMNNYCKNILRCSKDVSQSCTYLDTDDLSSKEKNIVEKSCQLGLMPGDLSSKYFNPYKTGTRATFGAALSRALRGDLYEGGSPYYKNHLNALKNAGIMTQINNPEDTPVIKGYVLITLKSIATGSDECTTCGTNQNTSTGTNKCDLNKDNTVDISDIVRYNNKCRAHESNSPKACDLNGDGKFDISDDIVMENKCVGGEMAGNNKQETTETIETNKRFPDLGTLVYIKKQINLGSTTQYTIGIEKDDEKMPVYNVGLFSSSDCVGSTLNTEPQKSLGEGGREYSDGEVIEAINMEKAQSINSIDYMYDQGKYVCISKKDYPDYFKVNGESRKVYKYSTQESSNEVLSNGYSKEMNEAYQFAYENGITTASSIEKARMNSSLTRIAMAKMLSYYAINVLGQEPDLSKGVPNFLDVPRELDKKYDNGVTLAYQLGIMGQNMKSNKFRPYDEVTRGEFAAALSRMLYGIEDGKGKVKYYEPHMAKLYEEGIITKMDPKMKERRGYVMAMLGRTED